MFPVLFDVKLEFPKRRLYQLVCQVNRDFLIWSQLSQSVPDFFGLDNGQNPIVQVIVVVNIPKGACNDDLEAIICQSPSSVFPRGTCSEVVPRYEDTGFLDTQAD